METKIEKFKVYNKPYFILELYAIYTNIPYQIPLSNPSNKNEIQSRSTAQPNY